MLDVTGEPTIVGRNRELLELSELLPNDWPPVADPIEDGEIKLYEPVDAPAEANRRDGAIEPASEGADDKAGNFTVKLVDPKAGSAAGAFIPKSSAVARAVATLVITPQNNSINLRLIILAPIMQSRRLIYRWLNWLNRRRTLAIGLGDERLAVAGRDCVSDDDGSKLGVRPTSSLATMLTVSLSVFFSLPRRLAGIGRVAPSACGQSGS